MDVVLKNEKLSEHFATMKKAEEMWDTKAPVESMSEEYGNWLLAHPETILYGYLSSFLECCKKSNVKIDLTYGTVKNISMGLIFLFSAQKRGGIPLEENREIIIKTLAAVLTYLAINEHNAGFYIIDYLPMIKKGKQPEYPIWSFYSLGAKRKTKCIDFLPAAVNSVVNAFLLVEDGLSLDIDSVVEEYKKFTGIDLSEYGLSDVVIN